MHANDEFAEVRGAPLEFAEDGGNSPDKHAGIPTKISLAEKGFGEIGRGFFAEAHHIEDGLGVGKSGGALFDVTEAGAGPGGFDADGDEGFRFLGGIGGEAEIVLKGGSIADEMVGWEHDHGGGAVASGDEAHAEGDGGGGVAFIGFGDDVFVGESGDDASHGGFLLLIGEDEDILAGHETVETCDRVFEQCVFGKKVEQLLGSGTSAERPEAFSASPSKNQDKKGVGH